MPCRSPKIRLLLGCVGAPHAPDARRVGGPSLLSGPGYQPNNACPAPRCSIMPRRMVRLEGSEAWRRTKLWRGSTRSDVDASWDGVRGSHDTGLGRGLGPQWCNTLWHPLTHLLAASACARMVGSDHTWQQFGLSGPLKALKGLLTSVAGCNWRVPFSFFRAPPSQSSLM
jgi:hypothetical protein